MTRPLTPRIPSRVRQYTTTALLVIGIFYAGFQAWKDEHAKVTALTTAYESQHNRDDIILGLQTYYEQATELMKQGVSLGNIDDATQINDFCIKIDQWAVRLETWVRDHMGEAAVGRLIEFNGNPVRVNLRNTKLSESLTMLLHLKKNVADLVETSSWDKKK